MRVMLTHVATGTFSKPFTFFHLLLFYRYFKSKKYKCSVYQSTHNTTRWQSENQDMKIATTLCWRQYSESGFVAIPFCKFFQARLGTLKDIFTLRERGWMGFRSGSCHDVMNLAQAESSQGGETSRRSSRKMFKKKEICLWWTHEGVSFTQMVYG